MGTQPPFQKGGGAPNFWPMSIVAKRLDGSSMELGLGPGDFVLGGDPALPPLKGGGAPPPIFGPCLLWPNGWMDEAGTWHKGRPQPRQLYVRWGPSPLPQKTLPQFSDHFYCGQTAGCIKMPLGMNVGLSPGDFVLDGSQPPFPKRRRSPGAGLPIFSPCLLWPKGWMDQDGTWNGGRP